MNDLATSNNPYLALGVRPFINCCSVRTMHGGSLMLPQVRAAMAEACKAGRTVRGGMGAGDMRQCGGGGAGDDGVCRGE